MNYRTKWNLILFSPTITASLLCLFGVIEFLYPIGAFVLTLTLVGILYLNKVFRIFKGK